MRFLVEEWEYEDLNYQNLDMTRFWHWEGPSFIDYTYQVDKGSVEEYMIDEILPSLIGEEKLNKMSDKELDTYLDENYEDLLEKHYKKILDHFEEDAQNDALENYDYDSSDQIGDEEYDIWRDQQWDF